MDLLADLEARGLIQDSTDRDALRARIQAGPVGVYYGCDPSADSLHVGNLIGLLVLRRFADAGHHPVALAGGATGMIGDPGGRSKERNLLDAATLAHNTERIAAQLDAHLPGAAGEQPGLDRAAHAAGLPARRRQVRVVNQMIARESVKARLESENGISFTEFSYQLLQANDYLHLCRNHDVELQIGGSDQWGNLLAGVDLIRKADGKHVHAFTWPLMLRSDGKKFGKSEEGAVWLAADRTSPYQFFQYWMNVADADIERFLLQLTLMPVEECRAVAAAHAEAPFRRDGQRRLAREITTLVHGPEATAAAEEASAILFGGSPAGASAQALEFLASEVPTSPFVAGGDARGGPGGDPAGLVAVRRPPHDRAGRRLGQRRRGPGGPPADRVRPALRPLAAAAQGQAQLPPARRRDQLTVSTRVRPSAPRRSGLDRPSRVEFNSCHTRF